MLENYTINLAPFGANLILKLSENSLTFAQQINHPLAKFGIYQVKIERNKEGKFYSAFLKINKKTLIERKYKVNQIPVKQMEVGLENWFATVMHQIFGDFNISPIIYPEDFIKNNSFNPLDLTLQ